MLTAANAKMPCRVASEAAAPRPLYPATMMASRKRKSPKSRLRLRPGLLRKMKNARGHSTRMTREAQTRLMVCGSTSMGHEVHGYWGFASDHEWVSGCETDPPSGPESEPEHLSAPPTHAPGFGCEEARKRKPT